jgi:hypothetical protein
VTLCNSLRQWAIIYLVRRRCDLPENMLFAYLMALFLYCPSPEKPWYASKGLKRHQRP